MNREQLDKRIRAAYEELGTSSHFDAWGKVQANLDVDELHDALAIIGPDYARTVAAVGRTGRMRAPSTGRPRKQAAADLRWQQAMNDSLPLGKGTTKKVGDCTLDDVLAAAQIRDDIAAATARVAEKLRALAEKMRVYRAATVRDLDPSLYWEAMR